MWFEELALLRIAGLDPCHCVLSRRGNKGVKTRIVGGLGARGIKLRKRRGPQSSTSCCCYASISQSQYFVADTTVIDTATKTRHIHRTARSPPDRQEKMCLVINTKLKCPSCKGMARKYSKTYPCGSPGKCNVEIKDDSRENSCTYCDQCRPSNWDSE